MLSLEQGGHRDLARVLREWAAVHAPDWTDANDADPGTTLLALFAFFTESLEARGDALPERGRLSAARLARSALALAGMNVPAPGYALARNHYLSGRLLGAEDFQLEQDYVRERLRRHNRALHGAGIVRGLQVSVQQNCRSGEQVVVQPGIAIDQDGEEIEVPCVASAGLPEAGGQLSVMLTHAERLTHPVAASDDEPVRFARIEEIFALQVAATAGQNGVALARLIRTTDGWKVDEGFGVARVRCPQE